jgi:uncharacterized membrane protein YccC
MRLTRETVRFALQLALVALLSYAGGAAFTDLFHGASARLGGLWSVIAGILVLQTTRRDTWAQARVRVVGTLIGSIMAAAYLWGFAFSAVGLAACTLATVLLCHATGIPGHARSAVLTVAVILVLASLNPLGPLLAATLRFCESCIGTAMAVLAAHVWPESAPAHDPLSVRSS